MTTTNINGLRINQWIENQSRELLGEVVNIDNSSNIILNREESLNYLRVPPLLLGYELNSNTGNQINIIHAPGIYHTASVQVPYNPNGFLDASTVSTPYNPNGFLDASTVSAPYIPLIMEPIIYDPNDFIQRDTIHLRYARNKMREDFYGTVSDNQIKQHKENINTYEIFNRLLQYLKSYLKQVENNLNIDDKELLLKQIRYNISKLCRDYVSGLFQKRFNLKSDIEEWWSGFKLPLVRRTFQGYNAQDFVSVQPMTAPSGLIFHQEFRYRDDIQTHNDVVYGLPRINGDILLQDVYIHPERMAEYINIDVLRLNVTEN